MALNIQRPIPPNEWLYEDREDGRYFTTFVILGKNAQKWAECTNEKKEQWEREHPQPEPTEEAEV